MQSGKSAATFQTKHVASVSHSRSVYSDDGSTRVLANAGILLPENPALNFRGLESLYCTGWRDGAAYRSTWPKCDNCQ